LENSEKLSGDKDAVRMDVGVIMFMKMKIKSSRLDPFSLKKNGQSPRTSIEIYAWFSGVSPDM